MTRTSPSTALSAISAAKQALAGGPSSRRSFATSRRALASYGFIGLGRMGYPMAKNLRTKIPAGDKLYIHDVNPAVTEQFAAELGGYDVTISDGVREIAEASETVLTVLPAPHHVQNVFREMLKPPSLLTASPVSSPRLFIDCSTVDPRTSATVANVTHSSGQGTFIDAPMSGGVVGAAAAKLTFMIGAEPAHVPRATAVLRLMGARVVHLGPQTSGLKGKLANNYLLAVNNIATAEAMHMGVRWGLDPKALADMINSSTGRCWPSDVNNPVPGVSEGAPASRDYKGGFGTGLMLKDLELALAAAAEARVAPRLGLHAKDIYAAVEGCPELKGKDFSIVYKYLGGKGA